MPIGLVYKPACICVPSLASSALNLLSNLVSSLGLPVQLKPHQASCHKAALQEDQQELYVSLHYTWVCAARDLITQAM